jgi:endonuclease/exonuclease/phosphatase family metal-dependent hydrolase
MTFNIRYATDRDGDNRWTARRQMLADLLRKQNPDLIGVQEALDAQLSDILRAVPGYAVAGVGRDDGRAAGEYSAVLFRSSRFRVAQAGTFWFSATPEAVASRTWGNRIPRICSWARLIDQNGQALWIYNVHLDHESQPSREESVRLLLQRIKSRPDASEPAIVTGDFNVGEGNPALEPLLGSAAGSPPFVDTFRALHPEAKEVGTYTAFEFGRTKGDKIDYVLVEPGTEVLRAEILRFGRNKRYPSDHFPVTASIRLRGAS